MASTNIVKNVKLIRSEDYGYGFSILGGAGSQLPPIVYDIIEGSPASKSNQLTQGDIIWEINGKEVLSCTTKEVLNCLRLSPTVVDLKLKTDAGIQEKLKNFRDNAKNPDVLRAAITQDDLIGVSYIVAKKSETQSGNTSTTSTPSLSPLSSSSQKRYELPRSDTDSFKSFSDNEEKSDDSLTAKKKSSSHRTQCASSPPLSEDESDIESLHSFHYSPKAVDMPSVVRLAKRLYLLEGFKKSDVSRHLSKNNEFSKAVAEEYLHYYNFKDDTLDAALRKFLDRFSLAGETQERERVLVHFSKRYLECNPGTFNSQDAVHTLTCAIMLLNTDLHSQNIGRKMSCSEFIDNLAELNDGENFTPDVLKLLYEAIKKRPLKWAMDEESGEGSAGQKGSGRGRNEENPFIIGSNPFLTTPMGSGVIYKKGYIMRKCCIEPSGKKTAFGKRSWKMWFCVIQDLVMYLHKDEQGARKGPLPQSGQNAVRLHHALANRAHDYAKKEHVFRLQTADQAEYLLQTSDSKELQAWIDAINFVASSLSAPPMPGAVGSQDNFQRPLLPCSITKLNIVDQLEDHVKRLAQLERDLDNHRDNPPDKSAKSSTLANYKEKEVYLASEIRRYQTYVNLLQSRFESSGGSFNIIGSTVAALDINNLPVFEVKSTNAESDTGGKDDPPCVIPPPIPDRPRPGDSFNVSDPTQPNDCKDTQTQTKGRKEKKENEFKKELDKMIKEKEKREKKAMMKEEKDQMTLTRKKGKEKKKICVEEKETVMDVKSEDSKEDPRIGTMERLKALFKFSQLNRSYQQGQTNGNYETLEKQKDEREVSKETAEIVDDEFELPPPLPPKPSLGSPVRMIVGTRIDI